ncbi:hypothetical protein SK128_004047 [Halocaridina rubra]|uniref:Thioredoxin domain-containing protein 11 n=1 Tax=Halocaridina rubra TaxID=373956 RepID=A0AAN9A7M4_HALRR
MIIKREIQQVLVNNDTGMPPAGGVEEDHEEGASATTHDTEASLVTLDTKTDEKVILKSSEEKVLEEDLQVGNEVRVLDSTPVVNGVDESFELGEERYRSFFSIRPMNISCFLGPKIMLACKVSSLILLFIVLLVQSRSWANTPEGSQLIRPSTPFFPRHSLVSDFYTGDVLSLTERLLASDLSFVVYYAPWDRDSQVLRWELEKAARYHHEQIYFAAINCWHPRSECRLKYKIKNFPALVLHVRAPSGLETKAMGYAGPKDAGHIIRFLSKTLQPLTHVSNHADLARLQMEHNAVVLGFYEFSSVKQLPKGFTTYYLASLRALQYDTASSFAWGVITNSRTARALSFNTSQSIHIVLWNTTLVFTGAATADSQGICNWVFKRLDEPSKWIDLPGTKSLNLNNVLIEGPSLIVFTPDNPYYSANDPFTLLREVSLDYNNCDQSNRVNNLINYLGSVRSRGRGLLRQTERVCKSYLQEQLSVLHMSRQELNFEDETCCQTMSRSDKASPSGDKSKVCDVCIHPMNKAEALQEAQCSSPKSSKEESDMLQQVNNLLTVFSDSCREMILQYSPWQRYSVCCQRNTTSKDKTSPPSQTSEEKQPENQPAEGGQKDDHIERLIALSAEDQCKRLFHGSILAPPALLKDNQFSSTVTGLISGLGCKTNKTLSFVAVDSLQHKNVAERLGINMTAREPSNTAAVIVDLERETHFVMDATLSKPTLVNFILNYTNGLLDKKLVSAQHKANTCELGHVCVKELTSADYLNVTQMPGQMVVVLHYSKTCAACTSVGYMFLSLANAARHLPNITFARIDTLTNTLPWHLYFETLPTIIVHPHHRKSESRIFDTNRPLTPSNLLSFIIANLDAGHRLALALSSCKEECEEQVLQAARLTTTQIHHSLTTSSAKLQVINNELSKLISGNMSGNGESAHNVAHYQLLTFAKAHLVRQLKKYRSKLVHLNQLNKLLTLSLEKHVPMYEELVRSMYYIMQKKYNPKESLHPHGVRDEL